MRASRLVPWVLLAVGAGLVGDAILRGGASLALVVVVPVIFGASTEFFLGVVVLFFGFVTLPLAFGYTFVTDEASEGQPPARAEAPPEEVGGLLLIGPVPIFFGRWKHVSRRIRMAAVVVGAVLLGVAVGLVLWVR